MGGLFDSNSGHLHPLNYCLGLAKACVDLGVQILNNLPVDMVEKMVALRLKNTAKSAAISQDVILATIVTHRRTRNLFITALIVKYYL